MTREATVRIDDPEGPASGSAPACVVQIYGEPLGRRVEFGSAEITVGREEENSIQIDLTTVSRRHARMWQEESGACWLEDLGSMNGSLVNAREALGAVRLQNGDLINFGGAVFKFIEGGNIESLYHEEIYRIAITDGLTQIPNRRYLTEFLAREVARATRHERPLCFALLDVDHFKRINDEHGHVAGDLVLREVVKVLGGEVRQDELLARYGGEEFAVVLPEATLDQARAFCERARTAVSAHDFADGDDAIEVTVSIGVAQLEGGMGMEGLIALADERLYRAKESGRNRTEAG